MTVLAMIVVLAAAGLIILAAIYDVLTMTIPNWLSIVLAVLFLIAAPLLGFDMRMLLTHLATGLVVLTIGIGLFAMGWVGGGDVKLAAASALWLGSGLMLEYLFVTAIAGGILSLAILILRRLPLPALLSRQLWVRRLHDPTKGVPYGVALAVGALVVLPASPTWKQLVLS